ncbi:MAG: carbon-nitrogen hydrolase [Candidatus Aureabacteria bacterium]|nr:carbon-nitrogen hydrolase [Candidatus Auribacterota bacterium]
MKKEGKKDQRIILSLIQHAYQGSVEESVSFIEEQIKKAKKNGAQIVCLQELFSTEYFCRTFSQAFFSLARTERGAFLSRFSSLAAKLKLVLIVPFFEKKMEGVYYNSAAVIDDDGALKGIYRKIHIPDDPGFYEKYYFTPGDSGYAVFATSHGKIAVLICWDQWFPEAARAVSLMGADIIFYPTAIGTVKGEKRLEKKYKDAWKTMQRSSAIANGVFVASVNRTGTEGNIDFWGSSFVCGPMGEMLTKDPGRNQVIVSCEISLDAIKETRLTWPFFRDRRVDTYEGLLKK